jgi:hypothetical protein
MSDRENGPDIRPLSPSETRRLDELTAALPGEIEPQRDLWPAIDAEIAPARRRWPHLAVAASVLVAFGTVWIWRLDGPGVVKPPSVAATVPQLGDEFTRHRHFTPVFLRTHEQSLEDLSDRLSRLPPESREVIVDNLRMIRSSIEAINDAVEREPNNRELQMLLRHAYQQEMELVDNVRETTRPLVQTRNDI